MSERRDRITRVGLIAMGMASGATAAGTEFEAFCFRFLAVLCGVEPTPLRLPAGHKWGSAHRDHPDALVIEAEARDDGLRGEIWCMSCGWSEAWPQPAHYEGPSS